jgi:arylsulfatase A-like enzyme
MQTVNFAEKIIQEYKPELLVVNMQDVDIAHSNFTLYANNIQKADYALAHLWNTIQNTPGMAEDTILIAMPEHGRNQDGNGLYDGYGREALDHTNDDYSREIFSLILGPSGVVVQDQVFSQEKGESIDIVPTIANVLGFDNDIPGGLLNGNVLTESFY